MPEGERPHEVVRRVVRTTSGEVCAGLADVQPEVDEVDGAVHRRQDVAAAATLDEGARLTCGELRFQQPPDGADVLLEDVDRRPGYVVVPEEVDQFRHAGGAPYAREQQGEEVLLLARAEVELDAATPRPQRTEDL